MISKIVRLTPVLLLLVSASAYAARLGDLGRTELLPVHIVAMSVSTGCMMIGWFIARYLKKKSRRWLKLHRGFQWAAAVLAVFGIATGVVMVENTTGMHFRVTHSIVAFASLALIAVSIIVAYLFLKGKKAKKQLRTTHRWIGRIAILAFLVTIFLGLFPAGVL